MSWRRFQTLLLGLSPQSRFLAAVAAGDSTDPEERVISDPAEIDAFVASYGV